MAIFHLNVSIISRSSGRSSVAASAYRSGEKMKNERDGIPHDYSRRKDVVHKEIMLPESAPLEYADRAILWNTVEKSEKRIDARTAREVEVALPVELDRQEQIELVREYIKDNFVDKGMCADFAIHDKGDGNPHAHIMLTTRHISKEGFGGKNRDWNNKAYLESWRENWAKVCNPRLVPKGIERIDHRTLEAQGIDREPTIHVGATARAMEKRGIETDRGKENREIIQRNENRATAQTPKETAEYLHNLTECYIIAEREIESIRQQETQRQQEIRQLDAKAERIEESTARIEEHKNRLTELQAERQSMSIFQSKKEIDRLIERQQQTCESARNFFIHENHISPEQAHAEIVKLQLQSERLKKELAPDTQYLTETRDMIFEAYRSTRLAVEYSKDRQAIFKHLDKLKEKSPTLSPLEILRRKRIERQLYDNPPHPPDHERRRERTYERGR